MSSKRGTRKATLEATRGHEAGIVDIVDQSLDTTPDKTLESSPELRDINAQRFMNLVTNSQHSSSAHGSINASGMRGFPPRRGLDGRTKLPPVSDAKPEARSRYRRTLPRATGGMNY